MSRSLSIQTAFSRAQANPLVLDLDGRELHFDPALDVGRAATVFAKFQEGLQAGAALLSDENAPLQQRLELLDEKKQEGLDALRVCLVEADLGLFDDVRPHIDVTVLSNIIAWLLGELSSLDPTQPASSSNGSSPAGTPSTVGAPPMVSTPSPSPSTEP